MDQVYKVTFLGTLYGEHCEWGIHFGGDPAPAPSLGDLQDAVNSLDTDWYQGGTFGYGQGEDLFVTGYALTSIVCAQVKGGLLVAERFVTGGGGTQPADGITAATAAVVRLRTGIQGRSHMGRTYWPGISGSNVADSGLIDPALQAYYASAHADMEGVIKAAISVGAALDECVYSPKLDDGFQVTARVCNPYVGTQRKRAIPPAGP